MPTRAQVIDAAKLLVRDYQYDLGDRAVLKLDVEGVQSSIVATDAGNVLLIRGTNQFSDWLRYNFQFLPEKAPGDRFCWHRGFLRHAQVAYAFARGNGVKMVMGHSLGAAAAGIVATSLGVPAITFATPRALFGDGPDDTKVWNYCRADDLVPMLPPAVLGFRHCGHVCWLHPRGLNPGEDHTLVHYLELLDTLEDSDVAFSA